MIELATVEDAKDHNYYHQLTIRPYLARSSVTSNDKASITSQHSM
jgi:hypothetical protein